MLKPLQAVIFDVDGTLYDYHDQCVHASTIEAVQRLKAAGLRIVIASARSWPELNDVCRQQIAPDAMVGSGGACIVDDKGRAFYAERFLSQQVDFVTRTAADIDLGLILKYEDVNCIYRHPEAMRAVYANIGANSMPEVISEAMDYHHKRLPIGFNVHGTPDQRAAFHAALSSYPEMYRLELFRNGCSADIFPAWTDKMTALKYLCQRWGIKAEACAAFGDGGNDIEMIRWAGFGVAMGNGSEELKAVANHVCAPGWEDGIAKTVDLLLR